MKKIFISSALVVLSLSLVACGSSTPAADDTKPESSTSAPAKQESSEKKESEVKNQAVADELEEAFNDKEKLVDVEVQTDVVDSESNEPHEVVRVTLVDEAARKTTMEAHSAFNSNSATAEQKIALRGIQEVVKNAAQNLAGENDSIQFVYPDSVNNNMVLAYSTKTKDVVPLILID